MTNWEKELPPIARERLARIGESSQEEKERMVDSERVNSLLSEFYQGQIDPESLWKRLKEEGRPSLLREAQIRLIDSLSLGSTPAELQRRREGILAIETLKEEQNTSIVELNLNLMEDLQKRYRAEVEHVQLTVDEAIKQLPQWKDFLSNHERRYSQEFAKVMDKLKRELK